MASRKIIPTEIGILRGRDCLFLDRLTQTNGTMTLEGTINCRIVQDFIAPKNMPASGELPYTLKFNGVMAAQILELDTWDSQNKDEDTLLESSFEELTGSRWHRSLSGKVTSQQRHLRVMTYDDVIDVICAGYQLSFEPEREHTAPAGS